MTADGIGKRTVRDIPVEGEHVLLRADLNVPLDNGAVADDTRIRESLPTIRYLVENGASVLVCSHLGRPKGERNPDLSLAPVAERLAELLGQPVAFAEDCIGAPAVEVAHAPGPPPRWGARPPPAAARWPSWRTCASTPGRRPTTGPSRPSSPPWPTST